MPIEEQLILVSPDDTLVGVAGKLQAHREGLLHRAFSIFIFDDAGRLLLQRRAHGKYHSGGLWTNTCCGHPRPGEAMPDAVRRRLGEEMGIPSDLRKVASLLYRAPLDQGLTEHEFVHIHAGTFTGMPRPDPAEAAGWEWINLPALSARIQAEPDAFTVWFRQILERAGTFAVQAWARGDRVPPLHMNAC
ncbi:isopentenyl-diphosphate Delta-isomerase [Piscinibacter sp. XHJ-5]|uniref:isopentenyl-diphosphate Delta-isomerase n=1 Tax=Piscinibacter sp. XHJ-5 TaxID=3037797 RepID=UPI002452C4C0|nr:isopentenyl-diphosphate Delta-isomerase [Piscinibacter sp. XHJ-5]